jgi:catechol 2,3-dioxygenase-like lactoylglutathione lyase family enzyme
MRELEAARAPGTQLARVQANTMRQQILPIAVVMLAGILLAAFPGNGAAQMKDQPTVNDTSGTKASVRYMIDDVSAAVDFYTKHLGFTVEQDASSAFASVTRGNLRLLLSGEKSSGRRPLPDGTKPVPGGWNRVELQVTDLKAEAARLRAAGVKFRREDIVTGPGGSQIWLVDPSGNLVELFQPSH